MNRKKLAAIPAIALAAGLSLAACGSQVAPPAGSHVVAGPPAIAVPAATTAKLPAKAAHSARPVPVQAEPALPTISANIGAGPETQAVKPSAIYLSADGSGDLTGIVWSSWTAERAEGSGSIDVNNGVPNMAQGTVVNVPVSIALSAPTGGSSPYFTAMTITDRSGNTNTYAAGSNGTLGTLSNALYVADEAPTAAPTAQANGLPADAWFPAGYPNVACGPPTAQTDGLNTSYINDDTGQSGYTIDMDDPTSSPCNS
jgi:hypothetical protein